MSQDAREALGDIQVLLGIDHEAKLPPGVEVALTETFYSLPYAKRGDVLRVGDVLQLIDLALSAVDRAETQKTISGNWWLRDLVKSLESRIKVFAAGVEATARA